MQIISEFIWKKNSRSINEDSLFVCHVLFNGHPLIVAAACDGVGGMPDGELASNYVISSIKNCFSSISLNTYNSLNTILHIFNRCLYSCHNEIQSGATTVCLVIILKNKGFVMSYGDTRLYLGKKSLRQITKDHSDSCRRLTQAIGTGAFHKPFIKRFRIVPGHVLLLCTDGFYKMNHLSILKKNYFSSCRDENSWKIKLEEMYFNAVNQGEKDNCSAIALSFFE